MRYVLTSFQGYYGFINSFYSPLSGFYLNDKFVRP